LAPAFLRCPYPLGNRRRRIGNLRSSLRSHRLSLRRGKTSARGHHNAATADCKARGRGSGINDDLTATEYRGATGHRARVDDFDSATGDGGVGGGAVHQLLTTAEDRGTCGGSRYVLSSAVTDCRAAGDARVDVLNAATSDHSGRVGATGNVMFACGNDRDGAGIAP